MKNLMDLVKLLLVNTILIPESITFLELKVNQIMVMLGCHGSQKDAKTDKLLSL